ncbi:hypothetical protein GOBAR_AA09168 [Gossypium barbadense]|uniref:CID domain-containing protein n=1 Tax=Gossypium barbadense TaxID=3634 RepID=A0A2P5Y7D1_GOSBA|nr:hypothetical protein GOBAR_AA09168 [Gossypium barbadense]
MNSIFSEQILADKLSKLNSTQQCIETLSHWCIFHQSNAELVVATWDKQFHNSEMAQKVPLLYLANDILQNSKRKGNEFVNEFWKVLPAALKDLLENGDDRGKNVVSRLVCSLSAAVEGLRTFIGHDGRPYHSYAKLRLRGWSPRVPRKFTEKLRREVTANLQTLCCILWAKQPMIGERSAQGGERAALKSCPSKPRHIYGHSIIRANLSPKLQFIGLQQQFGAPHHQSGDISPHMRAMLTTSCKQTLSEGPQQTARNSATPLIPTFGSLYSHLYRTRITGLCSLTIDNSRGKLLKSRYIDGCHVNIAACMILNVNVQSHRQDKTIHL